MWWLRAWHFCRRPNNGSRFVSDSVACFWHSCPPILFPTLFNHHMRASILSSCVFCCSSWWFSFRGLVLCERRQKWSGSWREESLDLDLFLLWSLEELGSGPQLIFQLNWSAGAREILVSWGVRWWRCLIFLPRQRSGQAETSKLSFQVWADSPQSCLWLPVLVYWVQCWTLRMLSFPVCWH